MKSESDTDSTSERVSVRQASKTAAKTMEQIEKALRDSGLEDKQLEQTLDHIRDVLKGLVDKETRADIRLKAHVIGPDGESREIFLWRSSDGESGQGESKSDPGETRTSPMDHTRLWEKIQKSLKDSEMTQEQMDKIQKALEKTQRCQEDAQEQKETPKIHRD